ncbi:MAG: response regulator [Acidobacteriia bacterium]|nr:response regulator [Terriglobia bacterium]
MAKILVADDNSNVQKTVALALAELGVEVVSVSNGEAAVRKLGELTPDLVLADIFMPVRNGYEVCEYVKKDSRFKQIPVVLLVGAFDPLDEREAQRVGADGILKKPFVPPDPLIAMIKSLLDRTMGDRLVAVSASKPAVAAVAKSETFAVTEAPLPEAQTSEEPMELEPVRPISSSAFEDGERPVAFGQLLDTPERDSTAPATELIEPVDNDQILTSQRDATLGDPIFWRNDSPEAEPEAAQEEGDSASLDMHNWTPVENTISHHEEAALLQPIEPLELVRDGQEEPSSSVVESGSILLDQASQAALTVQPGKAEELAANPIEWMATAPPPQLEEPADPTPGWDEQIPDAQESIDLEPAATPEFLSPAVIVPEVVTEKAEIPASVPVVVTVQPAETISSKATEPDTTPEASKTQPSLPPAVTNAVPQSVPEQIVVKQNIEDTARSIPKHDWEDLAAMLHASHSAADAELDAAEKAGRPVASGPAAEAAANGPGTAKVSPASSVVPAAPKTAAEPVAPASSAQPALEPGAPKNLQSAPAAPAAPAKPSSPDPALVEAVVQKVLDKMRPQVVEIITKEFLRPIVEALVHREIKKQ